MGQPGAAGAFWARPSRPIWPDSDKARGQPPHINAHKTYKFLNSFSLTPLVSFGKAPPKVTQNQAGVWHWIIFIVQLGGVATVTGLLEVSGTAHYWVPGAWLYPIFNVVSIALSGGVLGFFSANAVPTRMIGQQTGVLRNSNQCGGCVGGTNVGSGEQRRQRRPQLRERRFLVLATPPPGEAGQRIHNSALWTGQ